MTDGFELEIELDRQELATLLDRALALLPETTRDVLVYKYIVESPHAEIAHQLGLSESAVTMRLQRGKVALRKLLTTALRDEAEAFDLFTPTDLWVEARIWCSRCGQRRLVGKLTATYLSLRCPICSGDPNENVLNAEWSGYESSVWPAKTLRPLLTRLAALWHDIYTAAIARGEHLCPHCNMPSPLTLHRPQANPLLDDFREVSVVLCRHCNTEFSVLLSTIALSSPEGANFRQKRPRIRVLPDREIEFQGVPAIVLPCVSVTDSATFDTIVHSKTYMTLACYRSGA